MANVNAPNLIRGGGTVVSRPIGSGTPGEVPEITAEVAKAWLAGSAPATVVVYSDRCGACHALRAALKRMGASKSFTADTVGLLSVEELKKMDNSLGSVEAIPTSFRVGSGKVLSKKVGNVPDTVFIAFVKSG